MWLLVVLWILDNNTKTVLTCSLSDKKCLKISWSVMDYEGVAVIVAATGGSASGAAEYLRY